MEKKSKQLKLAPSQNTFFVRFYHTIFDLFALPPLSLARFVLMNKKNGGAGLPVLFRPRRSVISPAAPSSRYMRSHLCNIYLAPPL